MRDKAAGHDCSAASICALPHQQLAGEPVRHEDLKLNKSDLPESQQCLAIFCHAFVA